MAARVKGVAAAQADGSAKLRVLVKAAVQAVDDMPGVAEAQVHLAAIQRVAVCRVGREQVVQVHAQIRKGVVLGLVV
ncbi:hypothetical protein D3C77_780400 [compost metagenome]